MLNLDVRVFHFYREENMFVDALASIGCTEVVILDLLDQSPVIVSSLWLVNVMVVYTPQFVPL